MAPTKRSVIWYRLGTFFALAFVVAVLLSWAARFASPPISESDAPEYRPCPVGASCGSHVELSKPESDAPPPVVSDSGIPDALTISFAAMVITGLGTASTVILGWRSERRQSAQFRMTIEQLEIQLTQLRRAESERVGPNQPS